MPQRSEPLTDLWQFVESVRMRAIVVWHFKGDDLWGETIFFDNASLLHQIGASIDIPRPTGEMKPASFKLDDPPLVGHGQKFV